MKYLNLSNLKLLVEHLKYIIPTRVSKLANGTIAKLPENDNENRKLFLSNNTWDEYNYHMQGYHFELDEECNLYLVVDEGDYHLNYEFEPDTGNLYVLLD